MVECLISMHHASEFKSQIRGGLISHNTKRVFPLCQLWRIERERPLGSYLNDWSPVGKNYFGKTRRCGLVESLSLGGL